MLAGALPQCRSTIMLAPASTIYGAVSLWNHNTDLSTTLLGKCYCSVLARAIKLNLMVFAFAINFFSTATESCSQHGAHLKILPCWTYVHTATTGYTGTEENCCRQTSQKLAVAHCNNMADWKQRNNMVGRRHSKQDKQPRVPIANWQGQSLQIMIVM